MKRIIAIVFLALASLSTVRSAIGQVHTVRATIPFDFRADGTLLPAGTYTITSQDLIAVLINNGKQNATILSKDPANDDRSEYDKLIFNRYGDQYFLSKILCSYAHMNLEFPVSKIEKDARLRETNLQGKAQTLVALNR